MKTLAKLLTAALFAAMSLPVTAADTPAAAKTEKAYIGGGCFWCTEAQYRMLKGVKKVISGYSGGKTLNPTYEDICTGETGHAEVIEIEFDPTQTSLKEILELFWDAHDPTSVTKEPMEKHGKFLPKGTPYQGNDYGTQYRSIILYTSEEQKKVAEASKAAAQIKFVDPIATEIVALTKFYPAEEYHQDFQARNPNQGYVRGVVTPKAEKFKHKLEEKGKLKEEK